MTTVNEHFDCHQRSLQAHNRWLTQEEVTQGEIQKDMESYRMDWDLLVARVTALEEEGCVKDTYINRLAMSLDKFYAQINSMEDWLCHCSEGKGKEREVIKAEEVIQELKYASEDEYQTAPNTGGATIIELLLIDMEEGKGMVEGTSGCQKCGVENHPIIISDNEHAIPLQVQVEHLLPEDHVVSTQHAIHSSGPICSTTRIHSSHPSHIGGIGIHTKSGYSLVKAIECHQRGEEIIPQEQYASLGFASDETTSDNNRGDPEKP